MSILIYHSQENNSIYIKNTKNQKLLVFNNIQDASKVLSKITNENLIVFNDSYKGFSTKYNHDFKANNNRLYSLTKLSSFSPKLKPVTSLKELKLFFPEDNYIKSFIKYCEQPEVAEEINLRNHLIDKYKLSFYSTTSTNANLIESILSTSKNIDQKNYNFKYPFHITPATKEIKEAFDFINPDNPKNQQFKLQGLSVTAGNGGLHAAKENFIGQEVWHVDAESLYPSIIAKFGLSTNNFNLEKYKEIYYSRINKKRILHMLENNKKITFDSLINPSEELKQVLLTQNPTKIKEYASNQATEKLIINTAYGLFNNKYSSLYNPSIQKNIAHTGQVLIILLIDRLIKENLIDIVQINTDAVDFVPKDKQRIKQIIEDFSQDTDFTFEVEEYKKYFQINVNNYVALGKNNKVNAKGILFKNYNTNVLSNSQINDIINVEHIINPEQTLDSIIKSKEYRIPKYFVNIINFNNKQIKQGSQIFDCPATCLVTKQKQQPAKVFAEDVWSSEQPIGGENKKIDANIANKFIKEKVSSAKKFLEFYNDVEINKVFEHFLKYPSITIAEPYEPTDYIKTLSISKNPKFKLLLKDLNFTNFLKKYSESKEILNQPAKALSFLPDGLNNLDLGEKNYFKVSSSFESSVPGLPDENLLFLPDNINNYLFDNNYNIFHKSSSKLLGTLDIDFYLNKSKEVFQKNNLQQSKKTFYNSIYKS